MHDRTKRLIHDKQVLDVEYKYELHHSEFNYQKLIFSKVLLKYYYLSFRPCDI